MIFIGGAVAVFITHQSTSTIHTLVRPGRSTRGVNSLGVWPPPRLCYLAPNGGLQSLILCLSGFPARMMVNSVSFSEPELVVMAL